MGKRRARLVIAVVIYAAGLSACGGPIEREELGRGIDSLRSAAAEGSVLARGVADNRTRSTFVRVQARTLGEDVDHEAEKLTDAEASGELKEKKDKAVTLADRIASALGDLRTDPGNEQTGRTVERPLDGLARQARDLGESL
jgi:predicted small secreted protein